MNLLSKAQFKEYFLSFIAGLMGGMVVVFSNGSWKDLNKLGLFFNIFLFFIIGLLTMSIAFRDKTTEKPGLTGRNINKRFKFIFIDWVLIILSFIIPSLAMIMFGGMFLELVNSSKTMLMYWGQIALTIFGFCLIGAIFEKKGANEEKPAVIKYLFYLSIGFLISSICFFIVYSLLFFPSMGLLNGVKDWIISILSLIGIGCFVSSLLLLLKKLVEYVKEL